MFTVIMVDLSNPKSGSVEKVVTAEKWRDALRTAEAENPGFLAIEAHRMVAR